MAPSSPHQTLSALSPEGWAGRVGTRSLPRSPLLQPVPLQSLPLTLSPGFLGGRPSGPSPTGASALGWRGEPGGRSGSCLASCTCVQLCLLTRRQRKQYLVLGVPIAFVAAHWLLNSYKLLALEVFAAPSPH